MKVIRDPIYGYIRIDELALSLIDTPPLQRLRRIRQLGFAYLVYPGANHTRFEHSLGCYHLASHFELPEDERNEIKVAALLHDVSHGPYSHATEEIISAYTGRKHYEMESLKGILGSLSLDEKRIISHIKGRTQLGKILNSEIDVDRMDYLVRDAYYTGVTYGLVDVTRLIHSLEFRNGRLLIMEGGLHAAESLLLSRLLMYPTVYYHHVSRIAECMFKAGVEELLEEGNLDVEQLRRMDDYEINVWMRESGGYAKEMIQRINERRLFKRAWYAEISLKKREKIREEISRTAKVDERYVLVDVPPEEKSKGKVKICIGKRMKNLQDASSIFPLPPFERKIGIYTKEEYREKIRRAARKILSPSSAT
jgi:hypothetical protein